jgi:hypothetical protein
LENTIKEKDKEIRLQAYKLKELVYAGTDTHREKLIKRDFQLLSSLASPNRLSTKNLDTQINEIEH